MDKIFLLLVLPLVLLISACTAPAPDINLSAEQSNNQTSDASESIQMPSEERPTSRYLPYAEGVLDASVTKRRVLFFYASWCPTCRPVDAALNARMNELPEDLSVIRVNYNDPDTDAAEKALAQKYGVTYQHTFVQIDERGNEVRKWNGGTFDQLLTRVK